ncbi:hypothetical protein [Niabella sp.]|uniref:hypothetical protein n=1 Tax=Niabella sp. TaxID=1962976 RepID=UPI00260342A0|nr:hypothetical protein [Niabella sp.]
MRKYVLTVLMVPLVSVVSFGQARSGVGSRSLQEAPGSSTKGKVSDKVVALSKADSIALERMTDSLNLVRFKKDSVKSVHYGNLFSNGFGARLGLKKDQIDELFKINYRLEMDKNNAKATIEDKAVLFRAFGLIERQRDVSYKEVLSKEQYKLYLSAKRQIINGIYVQETKNKKP